MRNKNRVKVALLLVLGMAGFGFTSGQALAAATVTSSPTTTVSSDSYNTGAPVALPAITVTEGAPGDIPAGTLTWALPSGFVFDTGSAADVTYTGTDLGGSNAVTFAAGNTQFSISITSTSTVAGSMTIGSSTPLRVKVAASSPTTYPSGNITLNAGDIAGVSSTTNFGTLTQAPGAAAKLAFTTQPSATVNTSTQFSATVSVEDQFGNVVTSGNQTITLSVIAVDPTTTTGSLSNGSAVANSGVATFGNLSFNATGTIQLLANSSPLAAATSSNIVVSASTITPTPVTPPQACNLHNGILVKIGDSPTVYMVVNCVLRPFTSAAVFHAKGKKFEDIRKVEGNTGNYSIGRPVGQGSDDDTTVVTPAIVTTSASGTAPSLSNLPDGTLVKTPGNPTVYMVSGGTLQPFTSLATFKAHKKDFKDVKNITQSQFSAMAVGTPVTFPDGTILKGSGPTIYVVHNGTIYGITSMEVFHKHGYSFSNMVQVQNSDLSGLPQGTPEN